MIFVHLLKYLWYILYLVQCLTVPNLYNHSFLKLRNHKKIPSYLCRYSSIWFGFHLNLYLVRIRKIYILALYGCVLPSSKGIVICIVHGPVFALDYTTTYYKNITKVLINFRPDIALFYDIITSKNRVSPKAYNSSPVLFPLLWMQGLWITGMECGIWAKKVSYSLKTYIDIYSCLA